MSGQAMWREPTMSTVSVNYKSYIRGGIFLIVNKAYEES